MSHHLRIIIGSMLVAAIMATSGMSQNKTASSPISDSRLDTTPVRDLLHLIQTIQDENADYLQMIEGLRQLDDAAQDDSLARLVARNASNPRITSEVEALLSSPAYKLYYRQFGRYASRDAHRKFFYSLPYYATDGPGGVGNNLLELSRHYGAVARWYDRIVSRVNLDTCMAIAQHWLPRGDYAVPKIYFIYDGMGDAFANNGHVCFDLFSVLLSNRPRETRFEHLDDIDAVAIERTLAHEIYHVLSHDFIYSGVDSDSSWQVAWRQWLARSLVSEGTAMQCDPRGGMEGAVRRDSTIIRYWIADVTAKLESMNSGRITGDDASVWWDSTFQETPRRLLREYLSTHYPDRNQDSLYASNVGYRPDLEHTLGWWMVSHIADGDHPQRVIALLSHPDSIFVWYDAAVGTTDPSLRVSTP